MKFLERLKLVLDCLQMVADLWDWLMQNNFFFEAFSLFLS